MNLVLILREKYQQVVQPLPKAPQRQCQHTTTLDKILHGDWYKARRKRTTGDVHQRDEAQPQERDQV